MSDEMTVQEIDQVFSLDNMPSDLVSFNNKVKDYAPLPDDTYQVIVDSIVLKANPFYKEITEEEAEKGVKQSGSKYQFGATFTILDGGEEFMGRKLWDNFSLYVSPTTKRGGKAGGPPTRLYTFVCKIMGTEMSWDDCRAFSPDPKTLYKNVKEVCEGKQVRCTVTTTKKDNGKYKSKIVAYATIKNDKQGNPINLPMPVKKENK